MSRKVANGVRNFARALGEGTGRSQDEIAVLSVAAASVVVTVATATVVTAVAMVASVVVVATRRSPSQQNNRSSERLFFIWKCTADCGGASRAVLLR